MKFTFSKIFILILVLAVTDVSAQRFYSVVFSELPKDFQLYARDDDNTAEIPFTGQIEATGWDHMSVVTYRNKERYEYSKSTLVYGGKAFATFTMKPKIVAEMADYDFEVYACKAGADSVLIVKRTDVVGGDFYLASGQSNGAAIKFGNWSNKYARTVARIPDDKSNFGAADTLWILSSWSHLYTGAWEIEMQKEILEKYGIPTCVINGSVPGSKITEHASHFLSPEAIYGNLLNRVKVAKPKRIRAFFWYQGEQEALEGIGGYNEQYEKLHQFWLTDYPAVEEFIVIQINILFNDFIQAAEVRDYLRRTKYLFEKTDHFSTLGVPGYDGVHYDRPGYEEFGRRMAAFIGPKYYGETDTDNVTSPDIKKVFYPSEAKNELTLVFDEGQSLKWSGDTTIVGENGASVKLSLKDFFYKDGDYSKAAGVQSGKASGNRVTLTFSSAIDAKSLNYMPPAKPDNVPYFVGPYILNKRGLAAFTFNNVAIGEPLTIASFKAAESTAGSVLLSWDNLDANSYILERKVEGESDYTPLITIAGKAAGYEDKNVKGNMLYNYRLQAFSDLSESKTVETSIKFSPILAVEPQHSVDVLTVYPNPATDRIFIKFKRPVSGNLQLFNKQGQALLSYDIASKKEFTVITTNLATGVYVLSFKNSNGAVFSKEVLK